MQKIGQYGERERNYKATPTGKEETTEKQKERTMKFKAKGGNHFTEDGRIAEITVDWVLRGRARKELPTLVEE